ncbi:RNA-guided endonuclease TnpB family protein [Candidatus Pacearchaeota archaeon]|nr:RNA-guided endonuclease TnpB family protein [Candidatus Pacearchaeota archaeon]
MSILKNFLQDYTICVNQFINILWDMKKFSGKFVEREILDKVETSLSAAGKQSVAQTALHIVKSQRKRKKKTKPVFSGKSFELDQRFINIQEGENSFDLWIKLNNLGLGKSIYLPSKKHKHFLKFYNNGWELKQCGRVKIKEGKLFLDVFFKKETSELKETGSIIGLDCGYKKLAVTSENQVIGSELQTKIEKISRKQQDSKAFKRSLTERDNYINREIKNLQLNKLKTIVVEDLKNVKHKTKGKINTKFMNKLQRWVYSYFLRRLQLTCEESGVQIHKVNPAYTSQTCPNCGYIHKDNRIGEVFKCKSCGYTEDSDYVGSLNILNRFLLSVFSDPMQESCLLC